MQEPKRESERPVKVEIGQRWYEGVEYESYTVAEIRADGCARLEFDNYKLPPESCWYRPEQILRDTYLGGGPSGEAVMEADAKGLPVSCLKCGGEKGPHRNYSCQSCGIRNDMLDAIKEWQAGARNFPRKPAPLTPPAKPVTSYTCKHGNVGLCSSCNQEAQARGPVYGRLIGEMRAQDGTPLTALERIQAKKAPEPWRPSVDDFDLLPDAPGVVR